MRLKEGMIVHCKTQEDARIFLDECKKQGFHDPYYYKYTDWEQFKEDTCYRICNKNFINYSYKEFYARYGYTITDFDDLFKIDSKLKVGDVVKIKRNLKVGNKYGDIEFLKGMSKRVGDEFEIKRITSGGNYELNHGLYSLCYSKEMLEKVKEEKKMSKCKIYEMPDYVRDEVKKVIVNDRTVVVILKSGHKGVATCSPEDKFVESVGYQIALLRARINKNEDNLKEKKDILNSITNNPKLIENVNIL